MDYMNFIGVVIDRTAAQLDLSPIPTPAPSAAACCHSWSRRSAWWPRISPVRSAANST